MKALFLLLSLLIAATGYAHDVLAPGGETSGGGGAYRCRESGSKYPYSGFYTIDYIFGFPDDLDGIVPFDKISDSILRIRNLIQKNAPNKLSSFDSFFSAIFLDAIGTQNVLRSTPTRIWEPRGYVELINDPHIAGLPENCIINRQTSAWIQVVKRSVRPNGSILYEYRVNVLSAFLNVFLYQASTLFIHEWLWDFYEDADYGSPRIRKANAYLHSKTAETDSADEFYKKVFMAEPDI